MPKDFRFIDLFAGIGGLRAGFDRIGGRCVFTSEWNTFSQKTYAENFEDDPEHVFNGDITKVDEKDIPVHDVLLAGFPCFPAGTLVQRSDRLVPIEEIQEGDMVYTHKRRFRKVVNIMSKDQAPLYDVKITGIPQFQTTSEHPFYVRKVSKKWNNEIRRYEREFGPPLWVNAKDLTAEHYAALPVDDDTGVEDGNTTDFWYLVGRWLGDGWIVEHPRSERGREHQLVRKVMICTGKPDADNLAEIIKNGGYHATRAEEKTVVKFHISSYALVDFLKDFGRGAAGKCVPERIFQLSKNIQNSLLQGWIDSDGYRDADGSWAATSINRSMSLSMARIARNVYGRVACVKMSRVSPTKTIEGRVVNQKNQYHTTLKNKNHGLTFIEEGFAWVKVKRCVPSELQDTVFNFEVEEDNSYVAEGVVVHNCQPFSIAGVSKKNSMGRAHGFADQTQGTLFFDVVRILRHHKPKVFLLENVKNLVSHDKGNTFKVITETLDELGYDVSYRVISAKHWVPQNRERIFIVGFRKDLGLPFNFDDVILPGGPAPVMRDILHPEDGSEIPEPPFTDADGFVNPKYTLTPKLWEYLQNYAAKHKAAGNGFGFGLCGPESVARTLSARYGKDGSEILIDQPGGRPRRLTPRECARLMGFDRKGSNRPWQIPVSDSQAYKQFGNAVAPPVSIAIADAMNARIQEALALDAGREN